MRTLVILWVLGMLMMFAFRTTDPIAEAWACRCDTCCEYLDRMGVVE